jgi:hypothetical protein
VVTVNKLSCYCDTQQDALHADEGNFIIREWAESVGVAATRHWLLCFRLVLISSNQRPELILLHPL